MVRINLLPVRVSKKKEAGKQQLVLFAAIVGVGLAGNWIWAGGRRSELAAVEAKLARTKADIQQLEKIIGEVKNIKDAQKQLRDKLDVLDQLKAGRAGPVKMLDELATIIPKRLWLKRLEEKQGKMVLDGTAVSIDDVSAFMAELKRAKYFRNVELKRTAAKAEAGVKLVEFEIVCDTAYVSVLASAGAGK